MKRQSSHFSYASLRSFCTRGPRDEQHVFWRDSGVDESAERGVVEAVCAHVLGAALVQERLGTRAHAGARPRRRVVAGLPAVDAPTGGPAEHRKVGTPAQAEVREEGPVRVGLVRAAVVAARAEHHGHGRRAGGSRRDGGAQRVVGGDAAPG